MATAPGPKPRKAPAKKRVATRPRPTEIPRDGTETSMALVPVPKGTERGDLNLWGRVIFLPTGKEGDTTGATLTMLCTSLAGELSSVEDVGEKGEAPVILESFRFGKKK